MHPVARLLEHLAGGGRDLAEPGRVDHRHGAGIRPLALAAGDQGRQLAEHPGADDHLVRPLTADLDPDRAHLSDFPAVIPAAIWLATSSGERSSVPTVRRATDS